MTHYRRTTGPDGRPCIETDLDGPLVTRLPLLNKGTAFTPEERRDFRLDGALPPHVSTLDEQVARCETNLRGFSSDLDKHVYLRVLQDRNEVLFYALLERNLEEILPLIYTPTVAEAVEKFSQIYRSPRGLVVSTETIDRVDELLDAVEQDDVRLAVATDAEGILGIGDQGLGGMAIAIGKLSLYTAGAGVDPGVTLPVELDVGTDRRELLDDPLYLGVRHERLRGEAYDAFVEAFVQAFRRRYPNAVLQWEDFSKQRAFDLHDRYRETVPSFNDDVQGTGAVVLAGLLAAARGSDRPFTEQRIAIHGAGAGGVGVARQIVAGLRRAGLSEREARERVLVLDSRGLVLEGRSGLDAYKAEVAQPADRVSGWRFDGDAPDLLATVREGGVTALIGLSGRPGAFGREVVEAVSANTATPVVLPLSNPTRNSEAVPEDVLDWTEGRAWVATGSPFPDVVRGGRRTVIGQGNNAFVFPGVGLGAMLAKARSISDDMLSAAAEALAEHLDASRLEQGALYPAMSELRAVSHRVAAAVIDQARAEGLARADLPDDLDAFVDDAMWTPTYLPLRRVRAD